MSGLRASIVSTWLGHAAKFSICAVSNIMLRILDYPMKTLTNLHLGGLHTYYRTTSHSSWKADATYLHQPHVWQPFGPRWNL